MHGWPEPLIKYILKVYIFRSSPSEFPCSVKRRVLSHFPDTPLHSSETPRSSSLYQPESEDECHVRRAKEGSAGGAVAPVVLGQEGEEDRCDYGVDERERRQNSDISEDVADETDRRSSSESVSAEEVLEWEEAAPPPEEGEVEMES